MIIKKTTAYGTFYGWDVDGVSQAIMRGEFWEPYFQSVMDAAPKDKLCVDIGAHIGFFTVYLGLHGHTVHAFEANPETFKVLEMNVNENGLSGRVVLHPDALYDADGLKLRVNPYTDFPMTPDGRMDMDRKANSGNFHLALERPDSIGNYEFVSKTLDSFNLENVGLIKVDTEGCDLKILMGALDTIRRCQPVICVERLADVLHLHGQLAGDYETFASEIGYKFTPVYEVGYTDFVGKPLEG